MSDQPKSIKIQTFRAKASEHVLLAGRYQYIYFELLEPHRISFKAGQYMSLTIPGMEGKRSYSIASSPVKDHGIEILVDTSPQGDGSLYLASLAPGDEINFMAPVGQFVMAEDVDEEKLVFVATGSGISPIRSMILDLLETKRDKRKMKLHWGMRHVKHLFWEEDFRELAENFPNFSFDIVLSQPPESWPLCRGRVTDCLREHTKNFEKKGFYLCGRKDMIDDVTSWLKKNDVPDEKIHKEKFY